MTNLLHTGTPRLVVCGPVFIGFHIEVLAVVIVAVLLDQVADVTAQPLAGLFIPQVEQQVGSVGFRRQVEHPIGVFDGPLRPFDHALGFEPDHKFGSGLMHGVRNGLQPVRKTGRIDRPVTGGIGPRLAVFVIGGAGMPSGVEPEYFRNEFELFITFDHRDRPVGRQARILGARSRIAVVESAAQRIFLHLPAHLTGMMGEDETTETVVPGHPVVAVPKHQADARRADRLVGMQVQPHGFHP